MTTIAPQKKSMRLHIKAVNFDITSDLESYYFVNRRGKGTISAKRIEVYRTKYNKYLWDIWICC